jgi:hypothetical protein
MNERKAWPTGVSSLKDEIAAIPDKLNEKLMKLGKHLIVVQSAEELERPVKLESTQLVVADSTCEAAFSKTVCNWLNDAVTAIAEELSMSSTGTPIAVMIRRKKENNATAFKLTCYVEGK